MLLEQGLHVPIEVYAKSNPVGAEAGGSLDGGLSSVQRARDQYGDAMPTVFCTGQG